VYIVHGKGGIVLGVASEVEWQESNRPFSAGSNSIAFVLAPHLTLEGLPILSANPQDDWLIDGPVQIYCNTKTRGIAHGVGFGSSPERWRCVRPLLV
jgi:hypothetical protein